MGFQRRRDGGEREEGRGGEARMVREEEGLNVECDFFFLFFSHALSLFVQNWLF